MRSSLTFRGKILLLPSVAAVAFVILIVANVFLGRRNADRLTGIEEGYLPALEASRDFEEQLTSIQRTLQDAAGAANQETLAAADELRDRFLTRIRSAEQIDVLRGDTDALKAGFVSYYSVARKATRRLMSQEAGPAALEDVQEMQEKYNALRASLGELTTKHRQATAVAFESARSSSFISTAMNVVIALVCLLGLSLLSFWILRGVIRTLADVTKFVSASSGEILAVAQQTEANASDEAAFIGQTRQAMQSLLALAKDISEGAQAVLEQSERSAQASAAIAERINHLNAQALKITDVSDTIRSIADKSDILALNASLEGSRAGEAGRSFALVGLEMRRLAETVTGAVRQIKGLASEIRELSESAVLATEDGLKVASQTTETSKRISFITNQQRMSTEQVTEAMDQVQQFAKQALTGAREARTTAAALVKTVEELIATLGTGGDSKPAAAGELKERPATLV
jgi:methyl-accepting chemotaxis protein